MGKYGSVLQMILRSVEIDRSEGHSFNFYLARITFKLRIYGREGRFIIVRKLRIDGEHKQREEATVAKRQEKQGF